jgi:hypothetical protein
MESPDPGGDTAPGDRGRRPGMLLHPAVRGTLPLHPRDPTSQVESQALPG